MIYNAKQSFVNEIFPFHCHSERNEMQSKNLKKRPLCVKGAPWKPKAETVGDWKRKCITTKKIKRRENNPSANFVASSLYTREPRWDVSTNSRWPRMASPQMRRAMRKKNLRISIAIKRLDASKRKKLRIYRGRILAVCNRRKNGVFITNTTRQANGCGTK